MKKRKYLIKTISEECYIDKLVNDGEMFMRPLGYFNALERYGKNKEQGDEAEATAFGIIRCCQDNPVYCMYTVFEDQVKDGYILIRKDYSDKFIKSGDGYFAVIDYECFQKNLNENCFDGYSFYYGTVSYGVLSMESQAQLFSESNKNIAYCKRKQYGYQQEYRVIVCKNLVKIDVSLIWNEEKKGKYIANPLEQYGSFLGKIENTKEFVLKYSMSELKEYSEEYYAIDIKHPLV
ncbi:MAG: hypothetical protein R3Y58_06615 [Eubacteriales bacterium]